MYLCCESDVGLVKASCESVSYCNCQHTHFGKSKKKDKKKKAKKRLMIKEKCDMAHGFRIELETKKKKQNIKHRIILFTMYFGFYFKLLPLNSPNRNIRHVHV
ncbi:hypothetical protein ACOSQ4_011488 [Xanthoceras sorbifolium]